MTKKALKQLYDEVKRVVKIRVVESSRTAMKRESGYDCKMTGLYYGKYMGRKNPKIVIYKRLPNYVKASVLIHELGHAVCDDEECDCMYDSSLESEVKSEKHAMMFEIHKLRKMKLFSPLVDCVCHIKGHSNDFGTSHSFAAQKVIKMRLWSDTIKMLERDFDTYRKRDQVKLLRYSIITRKRSK